MGYGLRLELKQKLRLRGSQKAELKHLLKLRQKLVHPEILNMRKGLDGILYADKFLKERGSVGLLIGGLSESIWNVRRKKEDLEQHKDVDVIVLNNYEGIELFEGGIDWWIPKKEKINYYRDTNPYIIPNYSAEWLENFNKVMLNFNAEISRAYSRNIEGGLYLPGKEIISDFRAAEIIACVDPAVGVSDLVIDNYVNKISRLLGNSVPKYIEKTFGDKILSDKYGDSSRIRITSFDPETLMSIRRFKSGWD